VYLVINHTWHLFVGEKAMRSRLSVAAGRLATFLLIVTFAWIFLRSPEMHAALVMARSMLSLNDTILSTAPYVAGSNFPSSDLALTASAFLAIVWFCPNTQ